MGPELTNIMMMLALFFSIGWWVVMKHPYIVAAHYAIVIYACTIGNGGDPMVNWEQTERGEFFFYVLGLHCLQWGISWRTLFAFYLGSGKFSEHKDRYW